MLEGEHSFRNITSVERLFKHISDSSRSIQPVTGSIGNAINDVIKTATAKDPNHRYADASAFVVAFLQTVAPGYPTGTVVAFEMLRENIETRPVFPQIQRMIVRFSSEVQSVVGR